MIATPDHLDGAIRQLSDCRCQLVASSGVIDQYRITHHKPTAAEQPGVNTVTVSIGRHKRDQ